MSIPHRPAHTQLAYRVLFRPSVASDYASGVDDLVEEILSGAIPPTAQDADGTPLLTLMFEGWDPPTGERSKVLALYALSVGRAGNPLNLLWKATNVLTCDCRPITWPTPCLAR